MVEVVLMVAGREGLKIVTYNPINSNVHFMFHDLFQLGLYYWGIYNPL